MTLDASVLAAVLFAALLHAGWNAFIKSGVDKEADTALVHVIGCVWAAPLVLWLGWPPAAAWPYLLASAVVHLGYYVTLVGAYRNGELGLTYPIMRGSAPLLVALATQAIAAATGVATESLSLSNWAGIVGICAGVCTLGLSTSALQSPGRGAAIRWALANAVIIAIYTIVDGVGVRRTVAHGGSSIQYIAALFMINGLPYFALIWARRSAAGRAAILDAARRRWPVYALGAVASMGAYGIALWAMTTAPVAIVAALRETSVLFAAALGTLLLNESFGRRRAAGTALIVAGVVGIRLG